MLALRATTRFSPRVLARFASSEGKDGSAGSYRGEGSGDAFTKREKANEDYFVKQREQEGLKKLREEIEKREKDLKDLKEKERDLHK